MKTRQWPERFVLTMGCLGFALASAPAFQPPEQTELPNYDKRTGGAQVSALVAPGATGSALQTNLPGGRVDLDERTGTPKWIRAERGFLSGPGGTGAGAGVAAAASVAAEEHGVTKEFIRAHQSLFGFGPDALANARLKHDAVTRHSGLRTVAWEQAVDGIAVFEGLIVSHTTTSNELVNLSSHFIPNPEQAAEAGTPNRAVLLATPPIPAARAVALAAQDVGEVLEEADVTAVAELAEGPEQRRQFRAPPLNGEVNTKLVWLPLDQNSLRLCWEVELTSRARGEMFKILVDAQSGEALVRHCLTEYLSDASYRVFTSDSPSPFSPGCPSLCTTQPPLVARTLVTWSALDTNASPAGWIDDGGNETRGNNVDAHTDRDNNNSADLPRPQGAPFRTFDFPLDLTQAPATYTNAAVTDLFFWCNWVHDQLYELGFTESARNFQVNNFGRGGLGNDALQADAQDGGAFNNANMSTPSDGSAPRMQMYLFNGPTPDRDGDFDHEIVIHEYVHGLSNRRVGGGVGLSASQSRGMGEGWSDWYALALLSEPGDDVNGVFAKGGYATYLLSGMTQNYYFGIRRYPYSTDLTKNPLTFRDIDPSQASAHAGIPRSPITGTTANEVHNMGEVWCVALWEARASLIGKYGFAVGNPLILRLVTDGMNLSPANPNFLQARDAILQADLVYNGGADLPELWTAFAKRGMGFSATSPASSTTVGLAEAYDVPDALAITPAGGLAASGPVGGPFSPNPASFTLTNTSSTNLSWSLSSTSTWFTVAPSSGTLGPGGPAAAVNVTLTATVNSLALGNHTATIRFTNQTSGMILARPVLLSVVGRSMADDFDPGIDLSQWSAFGGGVSSTVLATNYGGFVSAPNSLWFGDGGSRFATTLPINATAGGTISFSLRLASGGPSGQWETVDLPSEGVALEYSSNGGTSWVQFGLYDTTAYYNWTDIATPIPAAARTSATLFRWRQLSHSGTCCDHWALDNVSIDATPPTSLALSLPAVAMEGDGPTTGIASASPAPTTNLMVALSSSDTSELIVPATVTILAGQSNATFNVTIVDDADLDGGQVASLTATATDYASGLASLTVLDNETATLTVALPASVTEGGAGVTGTVTASAAPTANITVNLVSSDPTEIQVPASVVLPAGQTSTGFNVTIVNDTQIDGAQFVTVSAQVTNWTSGAGSIIVQDNEPTNLVVTLPASAREGGGGLIGAGTVRIAGTLTTNLGVSLLSSDTTELLVPPTVTILAGQMTAAFNLTVGDDPDIDSSQVVNVTASAAGFSPGSTNMTITDDESPFEPFNPSPAHQATNVIQTSDLAWSSGALPGEVITNDVYFGTNPVPGPAELLGSTTSTTWGLPTLAPLTTYYWQVVARKTGMTPGPVWQFTTRGVDHFVWSPIPGTQYVSQPFPVTVAAKDAFGVTVTNFAGTLALSARQGGGGGQTVQVLSFTNYADVSASGEYRNALRAVSNYFPSFVESATSATTAASLQAALADKQVFLIPEQESASAGTLGPLGTGWAAVLNNFVNQGGIVIACSWNTEEHLILANSGLMSLTRITDTGSQLVVRTADHVVTEGVSNSFTGSYIAQYSSGNGLPVIRASGTSNAVVLVRDIGAGHVVMVGSDFFTPATGMDRVLANAVRWAQGAAGLPIALSPTNTGGFLDGTWAGNLTVLQPATNVVLRATDELMHFGESNPLNVELRNDLTVSVTDAPDPVSLGGNVTYTITVTNIGPASASGVMLTNWLPSTATLVSVTASQGSATTNGNLVVCHLNTLGGNAVATVTIVATATGVGTLTNQVSVSRSDADAYPANNSAVVTTAVQSPVISIQDVSRYEGNSGTVNATFTVTVSPAPALTTTVNYATASGSAVAPGDFVSTNGTVTFAPGETNKPVVVVLNGDSRYELNESFTVNLSAPTNATLADSQGLGTILNDDAMPTISIGDATPTEGNLTTTNAVFAVNLSVPSGLDVTFSYVTANGNATSGSDYVARSGSLMIPAGSTNTNVVITVNGDLQIEPDEVFYVDLTSVANAILFKREGVGLIVNDDGLPGHLDHFVWSPLSSVQYVGQPFGVTISAVDAFDNPAVNFTNTASLTGLVGGGVATNKILPDLIPNNISSGNYTLGYSFTPTNNLTVTHVRSYFGSKVSIWTEAGVLLASQAVVAASGTWTETPLATPLALTAGVTYRVAAYTGGGSYYWRNDGSNSFPNGTINQAYTASGDAFPTISNTTQWWAVDLRYQMGSVTSHPMAPTVTGNFVDGAWSGAITVFAPATNLVVQANDGDGHTGLSGPMVVDLRNDVAITVSEAPDPVAVGGALTYSLIASNTGPDVATGVVIADVLPAEVTLVSVVQSQGTYFTIGQMVFFTFGNLNGNSQATASMQVAAVTTGVVTNFAIVSRAEADNYAGNNAATNTTSVLMPTLAVNDVAGTEPNGPAANLAFTVTLSPASPQPVTVNYATANGTALAGSDYVATNGTLNFAPGQTNQAIVVSVLNDAVAEPNETFTIALSGAGNAALGKAVGVGTIFDNDGPPEFQIINLLATNSKVVDHNSQTSDDRGGIAISTSQAFVTGDSATARFNAADLTSGVSLGIVRDGLCTDLQTETVYLLGNGSTPLTSSGGTVTTLIELNPITGTPSGVVRPLSQSFPMTSGNNGIFSGYGRIVVYNGTRVYDIYLPTGTVTDRGAMTRPTWYFSESWSVWGVAEYFDGTLYLTYRDSSASRIVRARVPDGAVATVATFSNLSDLASFVVSPSRNRWYFHYEGSGQFGGSSETLGYADAQLSFNSSTPPAITSQPVALTVAPGGTASFNVTATGTAPLAYQWRKDGTNLMDGGNISGAVSNRLTLINAQTNDAGLYSVAITNLYGAVTSSNAGLTVDVPLPPAMPFNPAPTNFASGVSVHTLLQWNVSALISAPTIPEESLPTNSAAIDPNANGGWSYIRDGVTGEEAVWMEAPPAPANRAASEHITSTTINFDDLAAPCNFSETRRLTNRYAAQGVTFAGPGGNNGGAILNQCGSFSVSGFSAPNFLAFNSSSTMNDGGIPRGPETLHFSPPVSRVRLSVGSGSSGGQILTAQAYNASDVLVGTTNVTLTSVLSSFTLAGTGIIRVVISTPASVFVMDDLAFDSDSVSTTYYNVRFGTNSAALPLIATNLTESTHNPGTLAFNTTYYWQVVASNAVGSVTGAVWQFTTTLDEVHFASATSSVAENGGMATITVTRENPAGGALSVQYATTNGTATAGQDYTPVTGTLQFPAGVLSTNFQVTILDDAVGEGLETVLLRLSQPSPNVLLAAPSNATLTIVDNDAVRVSLFFDPAYVDTSTGTSGEATNVIASLLAKGCLVQTFTGITATAFSNALAGANILYIPELETGDLGPALSAAARSVISNFVASGGGLIINGQGGNSDENFINQVFGHNILSASWGSSTILTGAAAGTAFAGGTASLAEISGTYEWLRSSLPVGSLSIYQDSGALYTTVAVIPRGAGKIVFLAYDWFNAVPRGTQDGGWDDVLRRALLEATPDALTAPTATGGHLSANGQFAFTVNALSGTIVVVEASTNLVQWSPIHTNLIDAAGNFLFRDLQTGTHPRRFYRTRYYEGSLPAPAIHSAAIQLPGNVPLSESGRFNFKISGIGGQRVVIEASTNLVNWFPLQTNTPTFGPLDFSEPVSVLVPMRFYRVVPAPY